MRISICTIVLSLIATISACPCVEIEIIDETPFECPENEVYFKCSLEQCFKTCDDLLNPPPCPSIAEGCFNPACLCKGGYLRNNDGVCVPTDQCPQP